MSDFHSDTTTFWVNLNRQIAILSILVDCSSESLPLTCHRTKDLVELASLSTWSLNAWKSTSESTIQPGPKSWSRSRIATLLIVWFILPLNKTLLITQSDSIYVFNKLGPRASLFASFKYFGNDWDADMARMAANPKVREWWSMTDSMQDSLVPGAIGSAEGPGWWMNGVEVFHTD